MRKARKQNIALMAAFVFALTGCNQTGSGNTASPGDQPSLPPVSGDEQGKVLGSNYVITGMGQAAQVLVADDDGHVNFTADPSGAYVLGSDVTITQSIPEFNGSLDGQGHTLYVDINSMAGQDAGAFIKLGMNSSISNLKVVLLQRMEGTGIVGGLASVAWGRISNVEISGADVRNLENTYGFPTGGLVGTCAGCHMEFVISRVDVTGGNQVGGVVGLNAIEHVTQDSGEQLHLRGSIASAQYLGGTADGQDWVGGIAGENYESTIDQSSVNATVVSNGRVGLIAGFHQQGNPDEQHAIICNSTATGSIQNHSGSSLNTNTDSDLVGLNHQAKMWEDTLH